MENQILDKLDRLEQELKRTSTNHKEIMDLKEACLYVGLSKSCMYKMTSQHRIPFSRPGGKRIYFRKADLDEWMQSNRHAADYEVDRLADDYIIKTINQKSNG